MDREAERDKGEVHRRTGGLETFVGHVATINSVHRRTGGLEMSD